MPKFFSLEKPPKRKVEELVKELEEYSKLRPFLTFNFPINKDRKKALEMIKSEKIDSELLIKFLESNDFVVKLAMFYLLRKIHNLPEQEKIDEMTLPLLEKLVNDENSLVRRQVALVLGKFGELALPWLRKLANDENSFVREQVALALGELGEIALPLLEKLAEDKNSSVREQAILVLDKIKRKSKSKLWLLATKKPLFATPYTKELAERILEIQKIVKEMKDKFGDRFIGIVIVGSTAKGYFTPASDLDWSIIAKDEEVFEYFKKRAQGLKLPLC